MGVLHEAVLMELNVVCVTFQCCSVQTTWGLPEIQFWLYFPPSLPISLSQHTISALLVRQAVCRLGITDT